MKTKLVLFIIIIFLAFKPNFAFAESPNEFDHYMKEWKKYHSNGNLRNNLVYNYDLNFNPVKLPTSAESPSELKLKRSITS